MSQPMMIPTDTGGEISPHIEPPKLTPLTTLPFATVDAAALRWALDLATKVVSKRSIPILKCVRLTADEQSLRLQATDLDVSVTCELVPSASVVGDLAVPVVQFRDVVANHDGPVHLSVTTDARLEVRCGDGGAAELVTLPAKDFPLVTLLPNAAEYCWTRPLSAWRGPLGKVSYAVSSDPTRLSLQGVCFGPRPGALPPKSAKKTAPQITGGCVWAATDGHRLAEVVEPDEPTPPRGVIIPTLGVALFEALVAKPKLAPGGPEPTATFVLGHPAELGGTTVYVSTQTRHGRVVVTIRTIDGTFPDYSPVIPRTATHTVAVDRRAFLAALKRLKPFTGERSRGVVLEFGQDAVALTAQHPDKGRSQHTVAYVSNASTEGFSIGFNAQYLAQMLAAMDGQDVLAGFTDPVSPGSFCDPLYPHATAAVMPMRL